MLIELFGCTGSGKSTLLDGLLSAFREQGIEAFSADEFVLRKAHLNWVRRYLPRTLFVDLISISSSLFAWRKHSAFFQLMVESVFRSAVKSHWFVKLNIARNVLKKIGIYEIIYRYGDDQQAVVMDEGTINTANTLFVHAVKEWKSPDLASFVDLVPLPDVAIYLRQEKEILIERTMMRGHKRISKGSSLLTERFIERALVVFEELIKDPAIESQLMLIINNNQIISSRKFKNLSLEALILKALQAALENINAADPRKIEITPTLELS